MSLGFINRNSAKEKEDGRGYTLVEVIVTIVILGLVLLVVNVVLVALIRVSYDTDSRIKLRQEMEFAFEVMRRNAKSAEPSTVRFSGGRLELQLVETNTKVCFELRENASTGIGSIVAIWQCDSGSDSVVFLTSGSDIDVNGFSVSNMYDPDNGTTEIIVDITADSIHRGSDGEPLIEDASKQAVFFTRSKSL